MREQKHRGHLVSDRLIGAHLRCGCQVGWPAQISRLWAAVSVRACGDHGMQAGLTAVLRLLCDQAWLRRVPPRSRGARGCCRDRSRSRPGRSGTGPRNGRLALAVPPVAGRNGPDRLRAQ